MNVCSILEIDDLMKSVLLQAGEPKVRNAPRARRKLIQSRDASSRLIVGALCLNCCTFSLKVGNKMVAPTPAEFELLYYLMSRPGQVFSAETLLRDVWQYSPGAGRPELIRAHIKNLRIKIEQNPKEPAYLRTIRRSGYTIGVIELPAM
jgi:DNA-binding response OmpR family regulator